ncbi:MAG TPA: ZIP family metal transporter [Hyphomonas sp.]|nr:zinc ABC transporter permease [Hyphomonas sp.]HRI99574.1 ZIP family metal transporter [Hyphomonas sp.]HRK68160.1 ZIP family metal transporter [Hyphomonas sp.]
MPISLQASFSFGLIAAVVTSLGLIAVALRSDWSARQSGLFALSAGGMLITLCLLHVVPEALAAGHDAAKFLLGGFFAGLLLSFAVRTFLPEGHNTQARAEAITPLMAVAVHSFFDGVIYSVAFAASFASGVYASVGLIMHEFAEGIIAFAILSRHGFRLREALIWAFLAAGATTPLGALVSGVFVTGLGAETIAALYAVSAGLLIYVATGPMMKPLTEVSPGRGIAALASGIVFALIIETLPLPGHDHQHHQDHADHEDHEHVRPDFSVYRGNP